MNETAAVNIDHAGVGVLPFETCLEKLASVPVGRVGFQAAGEVEILPVNHVLDGHNVVFRTGIGAKLTGSLIGYPVTFEADAYDARGEHGWSVVVHGQAEVVEDEAEIRRLTEKRPGGWDGGDRPYWVRIRPFSVTGRQVPSLG